MKLKFFIFALCISIFVSCQEKNELTSQQEINLNDFALNTYTVGLEEGVDSVQTINEQHPLIQKAMKVNYLGSKGNLDIKDINPNYGIYYYQKNRAALIMANSEGNMVFVYLFNTSTGKVIDNYRADIDYEAFKNKKGVIFKMASVESGNDIVVVEYSDYVSKSWYDCWKKSLNTLYNDWDNDPVGTLSCCLWGPCCAVGGAIACGIQQL